MDQIDKYQLCLLTDLFYVSLKQSYNLGRF